MGSEQGSILLQNVQVDAKKMLVRAPTGQVSFLVGTNTSQSQTTTTKNGLLFDAVRTTLETHKNFTQSRINAALEVKTGRVVLQEIAGQTTDFLKRLKVNGQAGSSDIIKEVMQEEHTMTSQKTRSLSKLAGAVIALSVSLITQGMATPYVSAIWAPAANAAFSGLCSKATVSLMANGGNIGKVVDELTSDQGLKGLAQSMVTASVPGTSGLGVAGDLASRTATGTIIGTAFGGRLPDAFQSSLRGALVSTVSAGMASKIGDLRADDAINSVVHKVLHAGNGALMGYVLDGKDGMLPGAAAAVVAESVAESLGSKLSMERTLLVSKLTSALAGAAVDIAQGGDGTKGLATASTVGAITVENNWAQHREKAAAEEEEANNSGSDTDEGAGETRIGKARKKYLGVVKEGLEAAAEMTGLDEIAADAGKVLGKVARRFNGDVDAYVDQQLALIEGSAGRPLTPEDRAQLSDVFLKSYQESMETYGFVTQMGQGALNAAGVVASVPGKAVDLFLRYSRIVDKYDARAIGKVTNDVVALLGGTTIVRNAAKTISSQVGKAKVRMGSGSSATKMGSEKNELIFGRKLDFLFNKGIDQSNAYNAARAAGNAQRIGIANTTLNRTKVNQLFNDAYSDPSSIIGPGSVPGSTLREFFLPGVTGTGSKIQFVELSGKIITIIAK